jgi:hypothetical protein
MVDRLGTWSKPKLTDPAEILCVLAEKINTISCAGRSSGSGDVWPIFWEGTRTQSKLNGGISWHKRARVDHADQAVAGDQLRKLRFAQPFCILRP